MNAPVYQHNKINIQVNMYDDTAGALVRRPFDPWPAGAGFHKVNVTMSLHPLWSVSVADITANAWLTSSPAQLDAEDTA